jgi:hypothetical protein
MSLSKLTEFSPEKDSYDVAFFGTSRLQIVPEIFDAEMSGLGVSIRSYNMGLGWMSLPELHFLIRKTLEDDPRRLRWIVIDATFYWRVQEENLSSARVIAWHEQLETLFALRCVLNADLSAIDKARNVAEHLGAFGASWTNRGRGASLLKRFLRAPGSQNAVGARPNEDVRTWNRRIGTLKTPEAYRRHVRRFINRGSPTRRGSSWERELFGSVRGLVRRHGAELILVVPPAVITAPTLDVPESRLFVYNDPQRYPEFHEPDNRYDRYHLNKDGAALFSRLFAKDFSAFVHSSRGG